MKRIGSIICAMMLVLGFTTSLSAADKCGAGKCGDSKTEQKCGDAKSDKKDKCGDAKGDKKDKCGAGKCGDAK